MALGDSKKDPYLYHGRLFGYPKAIGGGGGGSRSEISEGDRSKQEWQMRKIGVL